MYPYCFVICWMALVFAMTVFAIVMVGMIKGS